MITTEAQVKTVAPCPACGTSRVALDYDDVYIERAGIATSCDCPGCRAVVRNPFTPRPEACLDCGHTLRWRFVGQWNGDSWWASCPAYQSLDGCPKCGRYVEA